MDHPENFEDTTSLTPEAPDEHFLDRPPVEQPEVLETEGPQAAQNPVLEEPAAPVLLATPEPWPIEAPEPVQQPEPWQVEERPPAQTPEPVEVEDRRTIQAPDPIEWVDRRSEAEQPQPVTLESPAPLVDPNRLRFPTDVRTHQCFWTTGQ